MFSSITNNKKYLIIADKIHKSNIMKTERSKLVIRNSNCLSLKMMYNKPNC